MPPIPCTDFFPAVVLTSEKHPGYQGDETETSGSARTGTKTVIES